MDSQLLTRIDALLTLFGVSIVGTLLLFCFALFVFDAVIGILALITVVVLVVVTAYVFVGYAEATTE